MHFKASILQEGHAHVSALPNHLVKVVLTVKFKVDFLPMCKNISREIQPDYANISFLRKLSPANFNAYWWSCLQESFPWCSDAEFLFHSFLLLFIDWNSLVRKSCSFFPNHLFILINTHRCFFQFLD